MSSCSNGCACRAGAQARHGAQLPERDPQRAQAIIHPARVRCTLQPDLQCGRACQKQWVALASIRSTGLHMHGAWMELDVSSSQMTQLMVCGHLLAQVGLRMDGARFQIESSTVPPSSLNGWFRMLLFCPEPRVCCQPATSKMSNGPLTPTSRRAQEGRVHHVLTASYVLDCMMCMI